MQREAIACLVFVILLSMSVFPTNTFIGAAGSHGGSGTSVAQSNADPVDWWPMFHHDPVHSGYSTSTAPNTNQTLWNYTTGGSVFSSPAVAGGVVYVGSDDGNVYALDAVTGVLLWKYTIGQFVDSSPAVADGVVYVGSEDGNVYAFGPSTAIPEFPSVLFLPLFIVAALVTAGIYRKGRFKDGRKLKAA